MNIGFDAYYLSNRCNTGIGNVVLKIILGLAKTDRENRYFLFTPDVVHPELAEKILKNPNMEIVTVRGLFTPYRRVWLQMPAMRREILDRKIDFFFGGGEYVPVFLPRSVKTGAIIHDCAFRLYPEMLSIPEKLFYSMLFPMSFRRLDHIFTISRSSAQDIQRFYRTGDTPIHIIPNGIDLARYSPAAGKKKDRFILFVGTIQPRKNLLNLLKGYASAADKLKERLVIVGAPGWRNSQIAGYVHSLPASVRDRIEFKGYISADELLELYRGASLFASPSLHEGFGLILLEAMACGVPVLTSDVGAVKEYFDGAVAYTDPCSPEKIGESLLGLLSDQARLKKMSANGRTLSKRFSVEKMAAAYLEVFNGIGGVKTRKKKDRKA